MARNSGGKRNFALRDDAGNENSVFSGRMPRQAAMKAARRLDPSESEGKANRSELRLREKGTEKVHIYEGWAWEEDAPNDKPHWMPDIITEANVSKQGITHLDKSTRNERSETRVYQSAENSESQDNDTQIYDPNSDDQNK